VAARPWKSQQVPSKGKAGVQNWHLHAIRKLAKERSFSTAGRTDQQYQLAVQERRISDLAFEFVDHALLPISLGGSVLDEIWAAFRSTIC
jgi:hypothetical protein